MDKVSRNDRKILRNACRLNATWSQTCVCVLDPDHLLTPMQSVSVAEYCRSFCERVVKGTYGETLEDNRRLAGEQFVCKPLPNTHGL